MGEQKEEKRLIWPIVMFIVLLGIDQIVKTIAVLGNWNITIFENVLNLKLVYNNGIAFGIGQGTSMGTFIISNLIVLGIIIRFIWLQKDQMDKPTMYALFIIVSRRNGKCDRPSM